MCSPEYEYVPIATEVDEEGAEYAPPRYPKRSRTRPGKGRRSQRRQRYEELTRTPNPRKPKKSVSVDARGLYG